MKMYLISDNVDTYTGMRLAGVEGVVVHERKELKEALESAISNKETGIILLTEKFGRATGSTGFSWCGFVCSVTRSGSCSDCQGRTKNSRDEDVQLGGIYQESAA